MNDETRPATLAGIRRMRLGLQRQFEANQMWGIRRLLTELYPDQAHFIFELLQNAEDASATEVRFWLEATRLVVGHNGRPFTIDDIWAITNVGASTKRDDPTSIGKFGVGFKAVFDYTDSPEVHSGRFSFEIRDLFVPHPIDPISRHEYGDFKTIIVLPFNRDEKPARAASAQIADGLDTLSDTSILFLSHIAKVSFSAGKSNVSIARSTKRKDPWRVTITTERNSKSEQSDWLVIRSPSTDQPQLSVAAAFALDPAGEVHHVRALDDGEGSVCVYFPAAKEASRLRFHIHAPFESTVARDTIQTKSEVNKRLIQDVADGISAALPDLAKRGYLDERLLAALPQRADQLPPLYRRVHNTLVRSFRELPVTRTRSREFAPASALVLPDDDVARALSDADYEFITGGGSIRWASVARTKAPHFAANPRDARARRFTRELFDHVWGPTEFASNLVANSRRTYMMQRLPSVTPEVFSAVREWVKKFDDVALHRVYAVLSRSTFDERLSAYPIVRVLKGGKQHHVLAAEARLPEAPEFEVDSAVPAIVRGEVSGPVDQFLEKLGARRWGERAVLEIELGTLRSLPIDDLADETIAESEKARLSRLAALWRRDPELIDTLAEHSIVIARSADGQSWRRRRPRGTYLDAPFFDHGWGSVAPRLDGKPSAVWEGYDAVSGAAEFLEALGSRVWPALEPVSVYSNPEFKSAWRASGRENDGGRRRDTALEDASIILRHGDVALRRAVWMVAQRAHAVDRRAVYQRNASSPVHPLSSRLVQTLRDTAWVPDRDGNFLRPAAIDRDTLDPTFQVLATGESFREDVGFASEAAERARGEAEGRRWVEERGADPRTAERLFTAVRQAGMSLEDLVHLVEANSTELPESAAYDDARAERTLEAQSNRPRRQRNTRERSVHVDREEVVGRRRTYLRSEYTNADQRLICQACHRSMPFKSRDGLDYFEAVQAFRLVTEQDCNGLALCPVCSAMYRAWRTGDDEQWRVAVADVRTTVGQGGVRVPIALAGESMEIYFTGRHIRDLQIALLTV
ncbi:sacsin N-terminal ATP-binding-like domain-containing protein [Agromyces laixinhei]|uniref:sacsin N-terminal ATP-binding-like domain-containing protein n=1 Tax=Agromyces laixinhei TaxID=2585717 RepID=UPI0012EE9AB0|nr:hypothetical protein [Agromyces laixinhei]